jgi:BASS family bile acid:Na+ symporter
MGKRCMNMEFLVDIAIPVVVIMMMMVVGLELTPDDFRRVCSCTKPVVIGTVGQLMVLPAIAAGLSWALHPPPHIVAGMVLVAASPGGAISNYYVYLARADVALSVTLTAVSTVLALVTLPVLTALGFTLYTGQQEAVRVPVGHMISQLFIVLLLPTVAGMWIRHRWASLVKRRGGLLRRISMGALVALVVFVIQDQADKLGAQIGSLLIATALFTLLTMMAGAATAWKLGLNAHEQFTFAVEYAARNLAIATVVGATLLGHTEFVVFAAAFFITQVPLMLAAVMVHRRQSSDGG